MDPARYRLHYHAAPERGWMNDPNGLCQFRGNYHAFFQYNPEWPEVDTKHWRHFVSPDMLHWKDHGTALVTDIPEDRDGVYSGSALVERGGASDGGDLMCLYYTGNVIYEGGEEAGYDYVRSGREANEILTVSEDGETFSPKQVLLRNADYPDVCTQHVRDPKVWEQDGTRYMLLGARDLDDVGLCLLYESRDGVEWSIKSQIYPEHEFGYMWECPNIVVGQGRDFLAVCPQGLGSEPHRWHNRWQSGYFPLGGRIQDTVLVDEKAFVEWDHGHDFYAPQVFTDDSGRQILVGWMGTFEDDRTSVPYGLDWCHCLTVPREVTVGSDGLLRQLPVAELESLRGEACDIGCGECVTVDEHCADIVLSDLGCDGAVVLDDAIEVSHANGMLTVRFLDGDVAAGRAERSVPVPTLGDLRILVDTSAIEIYLNGGAQVFSTRWFPKADRLCVCVTFGCGNGRVYPLENAMEHAFD